MVTGAAGFIGAALSNSLTDKCDVLGVLMEAKRV